MPDTPDSLRAALGKVQHAGARVDRSREAIRRSAEERRDVVVKRLAELSPATLTHAPSADEYSQLIEERGRLDQVLGMDRA